jgi:SAM-dependent methyltransferase
MEPAGMVHALEEIHRVTRPAGTLIEIHPALEVPFVEVRSNGDTFFAEEDPGYDYEDDLLHAEAAIAAVVERGVFDLEQSRRFELRTYATSVNELRQYWDVYGAYDPEEKEGALARQQDEMYARAHEVLERSPGAELVYVEPATMSRLRPSSKA